MVLFMNCNDAAYVNRYVYYVVKVFIWVEWDEYFIID